MSLIWCYFTYYLYSHGIFEQVKSKWGKERILAENALMVI